MFELTAAGLGLPAMQHAVHRYARAIVKKAALDKRFADDMPDPIKGKGGPLGMLGYVDIAMGVLPERAKMG